MFSEQLVFLALAALLIGTCHAQCCGRATSLAPTTTCGCGPFVTPVTAPCNLNPLTVTAINSCAAPVSPLTAYPLPCGCGCGCGCGCSDKSCLNVDQLINTLINALVFTTTGGGKAGGVSGGDPLIGLDLLYKLTSGGVGLAGVSAGGTNVLEATLGKILG